MKHGTTSVVNENGFIVVETNYRIYAYTSACLCSEHYVFTPWGIKLEIWVNAHEMRESL